MSASRRPLAAAPSQENVSRSSGSPSQDPNRNPNLGKRPKRTLIESACSACRRRKSKCDGTRPTCSRCQALGTECIYEVQEGESRWSALRRQSKTLEAERNELREVLSFLQSQPESEALEILNRLRSSEPTETFATVLQGVRERRASILSSNTSSIVGAETRQPPSRTMVDPVEGTGAPSGPEIMRRSSLGSVASDRSGASYESSQYTHEPATSQPPSA